MAGACKLETAVVSMATQQASLFAPSSMEWTANNLTELETHSSVRSGYREILTVTLRTCTTYGTVSSLIWNPEYEQTCLLNMRYTVRYIERLTVTLVSALYYVSTAHMYSTTRSGPPSLGSDSGPKYSAFRGSGCLFLPRASGSGYTSGPTRASEARGSAV